MQKTAFEERKVLHDGEELISARAFNLVIGGVLLWGFFVNYLLGKLFGRQMAELFAFDAGFVIALVAYVILVMIGSFLTRSKSYIVSFIGYNLIVVPVGLVLSACLYDIAGDIILQAILITGLVTLCLGAAVCVMSVSASAAEHSNHPICGKTHTDIGDHTEPCNDVTWIEATKENVTDNNGLKLETGKSYCDQGFHVEFFLFLQNVLQLGTNGRIIGQKDRTAVLVRKNGNIVRSYLYGTLYNFVLVEPHERTEYGKLFHDGIGRRHSFDCLAGHLAETFPCNQALRTNAESLTFRYSEHKPSQ